MFAKLHIFLRIYASNMHDIARRRLEAKVKVATLFVKYLELPD
ncbi:putative membrane domain protein [Burkholderia mallei]|uniref:Uncharacterized protein n=1 Tax=Burkholderia mallei (strain NCTC 10229) TaxID=412022 RepID=A2RZT1_BURM9|nr:hypothetical protein BMASAVP1_1118 [Burkholderia mallei SAVP1]ABN00442.2 hypothetical protein BMA10229_1397 [Burkholderia mallei NCTC 10229]ABO01784.1 hypothetical protein BMA10247_A2382 [Burkholderia mallei NCTC 10247]EDK83352.1 hypothetical protein BMA721280_M0021 [Burkholderia mallei 2002721280]EDP88350.1 hypothetical protein BMA10399_K0020 [Burkholderia mallei ATCC 10399]EEP83633.1 conserved hypothetical protein [Burkholderia mallei GB8 horse 4]EES46959.1 conserved hypothetical protein